MVKGILRIAHPGLRHAGRYQCRASNPHGVALSGVTRLSNAYVGGAVPWAPATQAAVEGDSLVLACGRRPTRPPTEVSWLLRTSRGGVGGGGGGGGWGGGAIIGSVTRNIFPILHTSFSLVVIHRNNEARRIVNSYQRRNKIVRLVIALWLGTSR